MLSLANAVRPEQNKASAPDRIHFDNKEFRIGVVFLLGGADHASAPDQVPQMGPDDQPHLPPATSHPTRVFVILRVIAPVESTYNHLCDITVFPAIKLASFCLEGWFQSL